MRIPLLSSTRHYRGNPHKKQIIISLLVLTATLAFSFTAQAADEMTPAEARAIAKEACIIGYP
ncbi:MAG: hypothetical protein NPIRA06_32750 [Nitrospirales bacterium]|nr:MAG: hypothetical protein NPIRA06_32750 [Nitrospirales bacterium]